MALIQLSVMQLEEMLTRAATLGAQLAFKGREEVSLAEMYRRHGRRRIDTLIKSGRLTPLRVEGKGRALYSESQYQSLIH